MAQDKTSPKCCVSIMVKTDGQRPIYVSVSRSTSDSGTPSLQTLAIKPYGDVLDMGTLHVSVNSQPGAVVNAISLQSGGTRFECRPEHRLRFSVGFLSPPQANSLTVHHLYHNHFLSNHCQFIIHHSSFYSTLYFLTY
jgi:hypothetical protein